MGIDPNDPRAYEKLRRRNIAEREKLFRDLKISQMKAGISNNSKKLKISSPKKCHDEEFKLNVQPSTSRSMPSRNCKPKNFHESDESQDVTEEDESDPDEPSESEELNEPSEDDEQDY